MRVDGIKPAMGDVATVRNFFMKEIDLMITFTLFGQTVQFEKWHKWSPYNCNVSTRERVIDWGYWRMLITK